MGNSVAGIMLPECLPVSVKKLARDGKGGKDAERRAQNHCTRMGDSPSWTDLHIPVLSHDEDDASTITTLYHRTPRVVETRSSEDDPTPFVPPATPELKYQLDDDDYYHDVKRPSSPPNEPRIVFEDDSAYMIDQQCTTMLWGWKLFDAGLQKALHKSRVQYEVDECMRKETEEVRSESILKYIEEDEKRQTSCDFEEEEAKFKFNEAIAVSPAESEEDEELQTEQARIESIHLFQEEERKRKMREEEEKTKWEAAVAESLAQHERDEKRRRSWKVIDISSTRELRRKFEIRRIPGDGLCLYNSLFQGLCQLGLIPEGTRLPSFLEHLSRNIRNVREYKEVYKPIFAYTDLETVNQMSPRNIRDREVNGRIDPLVKVRGALLLSLGDAELNGRRINSEIVWGDHLELFFILMIFAVNAVIFETDSREKYVRTQTNVLHSERPIIYLQKKPNHYNLLIPKDRDMAAAYFKSKCMPAG
uniref:OTU domain-containing protein n=1 Tax=Lotharella globosa TaxID=91324 RepID=A0A7S3Z9N5_9EUKA|mmetsp:Transcript_15575/g.31568  ORF Transcript_15575/g.31568 Transcript_15575/m.31568 type:complete len:476 (+) Transcript_15575:155-1582(+)